MMTISPKKKLREVKIFNNRVSLNNSNMMLHEDDMPVYNSWHLIEFHYVDNLIYRGTVDNLPNNLKSQVAECLSKIGNPKNILITQSVQDTY